MTEINDGVEVVAEALKSVVLQPDTWIHQGADFTARIVNNVTDPCVTSSSSSSRMAIDVNEVSIDGESSNGADGISIYPNPTDGVFELQAFFDRMQSVVQVQVFNSTGTQVAKNTFEEVNYIDTRFDIGKFKSGLYLITITTNDQVISKRVVLH